MPLPALAQTLWSVFAMDSFIQFCLRRFPGEPMIAFRIAGFGEIVSVLDPALIRELFAADSDLVRAGEANAQVLGAFGPDSLLVLDGERHLRTRRRLLPPFHGEAIRHHEQVIAQITAAELRRWPLNEPFALWRAKRCSMRRSPITAPSPRVAKTSWRRSSAPPISRVAAPVIPSFAPTC